MILETLETYRWPIRLATNGNGAASINCGYCGEKVIHAEDYPEGLLTIKVFALKIDAHKKDCDRVTSVAI